VCIYFQTNTFRKSMDRNIMYLEIMNKFDIQFFNFYKIIEFWLIW